MEYRLLGLSGCAVSALALGTLAFSNETSEADSFAQLNRFISVGGTLIDTALTTPTVSAASPSATAASQAAASRRN